MNAQELCSWNCGLGHLQRYRSKSVLRTATRPECLNPSVQVEEDWKNQKNPDSSDFMPCQIDMTLPNNKRNRITRLGTEYSRFISQGLGGRVMLHLTHYNHPLQAAQYMKAEVLLARKKGEISDWVDNKQSLIKYLLGQEFQSNIIYCFAPLHILMQ